MKHAPPEAAIYHGNVVHKRLAPLRHRLSYRVFSMLLPLRNISAGGLSFLHRSMLHVGTTAAITIPHSNGKSLQRAGRVVRSRHVSGMVYEIGLQFDQPLGH